jgi:hypothetical protein
MMSKPIWRRKVIGKKELGEEKLHVHILRIEIQNHVGRNWDKNLVLWQSL